MATACPARRFQEPLLFNKLLVLLALLLSCLTSIPDQAYVASQSLPLGLPQAAWCQNQEVRGSKQCRLQLVSILPSHACGFRLSSWHHLRSFIKRQQGMQSDWGC